MAEEIKKGLMGIVVDETTISQVMPEINSLTYRGYKVQDLCEKCSFEEVAYLVLNGELPKSKELKKFINKSVNFTEFHTKEKEKRAKAKLNLKLARKSYINVVYT